MLAWRKHSQGQVVSHSAKTMLGTALVHERADGQITLDMWRPDQSGIGQGVFPNLDAAKARAETILDPRATCWEMLDDPMLDDATLDQTG